MAGLITTFSARMGVTLIFARLQISPSLSLVGNWLSLPKLEHFSIPCADLVPQAPVTTLPGLSLIFPSLLDSLLFVPFSWF